jgi:hypothetical protein
MASVSKQNGKFSVKAYRGDAKTLLAFDLDKASTKNLAGFTIQCAPSGQAPYYIHNMLQFKTPGDHAQDASEPPNSSINAPIHKFRWLHVPGSVHQGTKPFLGQYTYTVTPRYFDTKGSLQPIDTSRSVSLQIDVVPFVKGRLALGFTRGFTQSQAFVNHFGAKALICPKDKELLFDTSQQSGTDAKGNTYTFEQEYQWLGFTAREQIFAILNEVDGNKNLFLDMFAYDLNEPDMMTLLLKLADEGRVRIILDNAALHHDKQGSTPEDQFEAKFTEAANGDAAILRGKFGRYSHDKVFIVSTKEPPPKLPAPVKVLTGSTNFSVTGLYVNSNHVLVFDDPTVAAEYAKVFAEAWRDGAKIGFRDSPLASEVFAIASATVPKTQITFSPHTADKADNLLAVVAARIAREGKKGKSSGSVLFAVMQIDNGTSPVYTALKTVHADETIFSYGISDSTAGICLYAPGKKTGALVTGKPASTVLPPPFNQVPGVGSGHQVHHKFVICGFNGPDAVVYCGSSNLANGGEALNGDNLLAIQDDDVVTAFAIEAVGLVDHFNFLDKYATGPKGKKKPAASPSQAAVAAAWFLSTTDAWAKPYFDTKDLHCADRELFR